MCNILEATSKATSTTDSETMQTGEKDHDKNRSIREAGVDLMGRRTQGIVIRECDFRRVEDFVIPKFYQPLVKEVILTPGFIADRIEKVARDVYSHYKDSTRDVMLVCLLKGASRFYQILTQRLRQFTNDDVSSLNRPTYRELYVRCSSYGSGMASSGNVQMCNCSDNIEGVVEDKHVVIVDDIIETGHTLAKMEEVFKNSGAYDVSTCILLAKRVKHWTGIDCDWCAFDIPDVFVVGFGMDFNDRFRDLDPVCCCSEAGVAAFKDKKDI